MANLTVMFSNDQPMRQEKYPLTWLLYKNKDIIEIHVRHDSHTLIDKVNFEQSGSVGRLRKRANPGSDTKKRTWLPDAHQPGVADVHEGTRERTRGVSDRHLISERI